MANHKAVMPDHVRQFCISEMRAYPLVILDKAEALREWGAIPEEGGNLGKLDIVGRVDGGPIGSSPTEKTANRRDHALTKGELAAIMKRCVMVENVLGTLTLQEWEVVVACYWHRLTTEEIEGLTGVRERAQGEVRTRLLARLARAWGMV